MIYLDCFQGVSGGTLASALFDLRGDEVSVSAQLKGLGFKGLEVRPEKIRKGAVEGTRLSFNYSGDYHLGKPGEVRRFLNKSKIDGAVKEKIHGFYSVIFDAEASVHGGPREDVHLHEIASPRTMLEAAVFFILAGEDKVYSSTLPLGSGSFTAAHGQIPIPAPATAHIIKGMPVRKTPAAAEMVTPTGAALIKAGAGFDPGEFIIRKTGYGVGERSVLRAFSADETGMGDVIQLEVNIDDMTPEDVAHLCGELREAAVDVYTISAIMKKGRPGIVLTVLFRRHEFDRIRETLYKHSSTSGFRYWLCCRDVLERKTVSFDSSEGACRVKEVKLPEGGSRGKAEYNDLKLLSEWTGRSVTELRRTVEDEFGE